MTNNWTRGFTLIELAIVLVLIGLLTGGVLAGKTLVESAAVRRDIALVNEMTTAVKTFQLKYSGLPGDMPNPERFFALEIWDLRYSEGDGNAIIGEVFTDGVPAFDLPTIGDGYTTCLACHETTLFWMSLAAAKLIPLGEFPMSITDPDFQCSPGKGYPALATNPSLGLIVAGRDKGDNFWYYGAQQTVPGNQFIKANSRFAFGTVAQAIDDKIDNGLALTGRVQNMIAISSDWPGNCYESSTGRYLQNDALYECGLRIEGGF